MKNLFFLYFVLLLLVIACNRKDGNEVLAPSINQPVNFISLFQDSTTEVEVYNTTLKNKYDFNKFINPFIFMLFNINVKITS